MVSIVPVNHYRSLDVQLSQLRSLDHFRGTHEDLKALLTVLQPQVFRFYYDLWIESQLLRLVVCYRKVRVLCMQDVTLKTMKEHAEWFHFLL